MKNKQGFTLVELLVVIAIIGILSTVAVVNLNEARDQAKIKSTEGSVANAMKAMHACLSEAGNIYYDGSNRCDGGPGWKDITAGTVMCSNWNELLWPVIPDLDEYMCDYDTYDGALKLSFLVQIDGLVTIQCFQDRGCITTEL